MWSMIAMKPQKSNAEFWSLVIAYFRDISISIGHKVGPITRLQGEQPSKFSI
jgi:hypothetical protein